MGHQVDEGSPTIDQELINDAQTYLVMAEFSRGMHDLAAALGKPVDKLGLEPLSLHFVEEGAKISAADYIGHCNNIFAAGATMAEFQREYDAILQPVTSDPSAQT